MNKDIGIFDVNIESKLNPLLFPEPAKETETVFFSAFATPQTYYIVRPCGMEIKIKVEGKYWISEKELFLFEKELVNKYLTSKNIDNE